MKAAVFKTSGLPLSIEDVADPEPGPQDVVLRVCACGVCGTDLHWTEVDPDQSGWRDLNAGAVLGHEFAGEIVEVGAEVRDRWKIGDRVCAMPQMGCGTCLACLSGKPHRCPQGKTRSSPEIPGAFAEYTTARSTFTMKLPENVSFEEGALVEPLAVGLHAVRRARLNPGESVLIIGGGPVGLAVSLWAKFMGARHIVVSDLVMNRAEQAGRFGATAAIDAAHEDVNERFIELTGGTPTVVFDAVGVPGSMQIALEHTPIDGRIVVVGLCMTPDRLKTADAVIKEVDIIFCFVYEQRDFEMSIEMLAQGRLDAAGLVSHEVGFNLFPEAFEAVKRPTDQIKLMLRPD